MRRRKFKKPVIYGLYALGIIAFFGTIYLIESNVNVEELKTKPNYLYVTKTIFDNSVSVVSKEKTLVKPYDNADVSIVQNYYQKSAEASEQEKSIIYYQNTYMQSNGVSYGAKTEFDIIAISDGTVTSVEESELYGTIIKIKHSDEVTSVYQSITKPTVKQNDKVSQGQIIGTSGNSNIQSELGNHLYFELLVKDSPINPEEAYGKNLSQIIKL